VSDLVRNRRQVVHYAYGYTSPEYFKHPEYATREQLEFPNVDGRKTLYWNPSVQTSSDGRMSLHYYSSDHVGSMLQLRIEGVTFDGRPVSLRKELLIQ
jgi:hypothetical protein